MRIEYKGYELDVPESFAELSHEEQIAQLEAVVGEDQGGTSVPSGSSEEGEKDGSLGTAFKRSMDVGQGLLYEGGNAIANRLGMEGLAQDMQAGVQRNQQEADAYNYQRPANVPPSIYDALKEGNIGGAGKAALYGTAESGLTGAVPMATSLAGGAMMLVPGGQIPGAALLAGSGAMSAGMNLGEQQQEKRDRGLDVSQGATNTDLAIAGGVGALDATVGRFGAGKVASRFAKEALQEGTEEMSPLLSADLQGADVGGEEYMRSGIEGAAIGTGTRAVTEPTVAAAGGVGNAALGRTTGLPDSVDTDPNKAMADFQALNEAKEDGVEGDLRIGSGHGDTGRNILSKGLDMATAGFDSINPAKIFGKDNQGRGYREGRVDRYRDDLNNLSKEFDDWLTIKDNEGIKQNLFTSRGKLKVQDFLNGARSIEDVRKNPLYKAMSIMDQDEGTSNVARMEKLFQERQTLGAAADLSGRSKSAQGAMGYHAAARLTGMGAAGGGLYAAGSGAIPALGGIMAGGAALKGRQKVGESLARKELGTALENYHTKISKAIQLRQEVNTNDPNATIIKGEGNQVVLKAMKKAGHVGIEVKDSKGNTLSRDNTQAVLAKLGDTLQADVEALSARSGVNPEIRIGSPDASLDKAHRDYESNAARKTREAEEKARENQKQLREQAKADAKSLLQKAKNILQYPDAAPQGFDMDLLQRTVGNLQAAVDNRMSDAGTLKDLNSNLDAKIKDFTQKGTLEGKARTKTDREKRQEKAEVARQEKIERMKAAGRKLKSELNSIVNNGSQKVDPGLRMKAHSVMKAFDAAVKEGNTPKIIEAQGKVAAVLAEAKRKSKAQSKQTKQGEKEAQDATMRENKIRRVVSKVNQSGGRSYDSVVQTLSQEQGYNNPQSNRIMGGYSAQAAIALAFDGDVDKVLANPAAKAAFRITKNDGNTLRNALFHAFQMSFAGSPFDTIEVLGEGLTAEQRSVFDKAVGHVEGFAKAYSDLVDNS